MKTPLRTCAGCGAKLPKSEMIRVGAGSMGVSSGADRRKVPGRGAYLCPNRDCLLRARGSGALAKRLREKVDESTFHRIEKEIETRQKVSIG